MDRQKVIKVLFKALSETTNGHFMIREVVKDIWESEGMCSETQERAINDNIHWMGEVGRMPTDTADKLFAEGIDVSRPLSDEVIVEMEELEEIEQKAREVK